MCARLSRRPNIRQLDPLNDWCWIHLGESLVGAGDLAGAQLSFERALALEPGDPDRHAQLGYIAAVEGRTEDALVWFRRAIELGPEPQTQPRVWTWMLRSFETSERETAAAELGTWFSEVGLSDSWDLRLVPYLLGQSDDATLLVRAEEQSDMRTRAGQPTDDIVCEARVYVGVRRELSGDFTRARESYADALGMHAPLKWERLFARRRLDALAR